MTTDGGGVSKRSLRRPVQLLASRVASLLGSLIQRPWSLSAASASLERRGFHLLPHHYTVPIPDRSDCDDAFWRTSSDLVGLDMNERSALKMLKQVISPYLDEFRDRFPIFKSNERPGFFLINGNYMAVDAHVYYAFVRHFKPKRVVEIGSGNSTLVAAAAVRANLEEGRRTELVAIEPFPGPGLQSGIEGLSRLIPSKVQEVPMDLFTALEENDILFIDSSHVLRSGNDVQHEYLEILPRLAPGVLIHIHDISLPRPYPKVYFDTRLYWNEQYLLQAFLAFNSRFEVIWPGNFLMERHQDLMYEVFPEFETMRQHYPDSEPTAFWLRVRS